MSAIQREIEQAADGWMQAWVRCDEAALETVLAPDLALIVSATPEKLLDRAAWLATACSRYRATEFAYLDVQVRELGPGLAVMSAIAEFKATIDGVARNGPLFLVDVWRRIDGAWRVSVRYSSSPEPGQAVGAAVAALR